MEATTQPVTVQAIINAPVAEVWNKWNAPEHITQWCFASDDWHAPYSENDVRVGGNIKTTMAAKDGSFSFEFGGTYSEVEENRYLAYTLGDGRKVTVLFEQEGNGTKVVETFDPENTHPVDFQQAGWQAILDNFKKYAEQ